MNAKVVILAQAIAKAEGFYIAGSLPQRCHNPGDLEIQSVGYGTDNGKTIFPDDEAGWMALEHECDLILYGLSRAGYKLTDTIMQMAFRYTGNDGATTWALTVARALGISTLTTLEQYMGEQ
jgi:hypothetical protein